MSVDDVILGNLVPTWVFGVLDLLAFGKHYKVQWFALRELVLSPTVPLLHTTVPWRHTLKTHFY